MQSDSKSKSNHKLLESKMKYFTWISSLRIGFNFLTKRRKERMKETIKTYSNVRSSDSVSHANFAYAQYLISCEYYSILFRVWVIRHFAIKFGQKMFLCVSYTLCTIHMKTLDQKNIRSITAQWYLCTVYERNVPKKM